MPDPNTCINIIRTEIPKHLRGFQKVPFEKKCRPYLPSPKTLVELAGEAVNVLPLPACWEWSVEDVGHWVETELGFPQYKECFTKNLINGKTLILVDATGLPKLNICDFQHMKHITAGVRRLYRSTMEQFSRSIRLPPFSFETHYLHYRINHNVTRMEFFRKFHLIEEEKRVLDHWDLINPYWPEFPGKTLVAREGRCCCAIIAPPLN